MVVGVVTPVGVETETDPAFIKAQGPGQNWSPSKNAAVKTFLARREQKLKIKKSRESSNQLMDVLLPSIAASHAMSLVATGAATGGEAAKLAKKFESAQRETFKASQKEVPPKKEGPSDIME